jgi:uncharacterized membrane protein
MELATESPSSDAWWRALRTALLVVGAALCLAGVVFFFAYNWASLGRLAKLATVAGALLAAGGGAFYVGLERALGKASLFAAATLTGVLLAVYGQAYQTGADSYLLFGTWALLIAPWAFGTASAPVFVLFVGLLEVSLLTYWDARGYVDDHRVWLSLSSSAIPGAAWLAAEALSERVKWLAPRALARTFGLVTFFPITLGACAFIVVLADRRPVDALPLVAVVLLVGGTVARFRGRDAFLLACAAASAITVVTTAIGHALTPAHGESSLTFLLVGLILVGEVAAATAWLRAEIRAIGGDE